MSAQLEELLPKLVANGLRPDVIVLDPPRKGCDPAVLQAIIAAAPKRVVYVSCGAPTLARDAKLLAEGGYAAEKVQCVDMFCWTGAVETVMSLVQQKPDDIVKVGIDADELSITKAEGKATYGEIQTRVKEQTGLNVTPLYIAQVKRKHGIIERECYNKAKSESAKMLICPPDKEKAIEEALRFFGMIVDEYKHRNRSIIPDTEKSWFPALTLPRTTTSILLTRGADHQPQSPCSAPHAQAIC